MQAIRSLWQPLAIALVLASPCLADDGMAWESDLEAAKHAAARGNRLVLVHFAAPWCQPCQALEQNVFRKPGFGKELDANFVCVKLNIDDYPMTARQYGVATIPTDVILTPQGQLIDRLQSPPTGPEFVAAMNRVAAVAKSGGRPPAGQATVSPAVMAPASAAPPAAASAAPPGSASGANRTAEDRYVDYYNRRRAAQQAQTAAPYSQAVPQPATQSAAAPAPTTIAAASPIENPATSAPQVAAPIIPPIVAQPPVQPRAPAAPAPASAKSTPGYPQVPPGNAPLGLDGYCPVTLCERQAWSLGDVRFGMQHRGRTYLFAGPEELERFRQNPDLYSPVMSGNDPVMALDHGQQVVGSRMYGLMCGGHVYLFSSEETLQKFMQNRSRYAVEALEARR
ncbi:MAG: thioredoxin family protein [Planctomycetia bacterium]|nr:thioredoxin family protein [Planctomycetia bacterium]